MYSEKKKDSIGPLCWVRGGCIAIKRGTEIPMPNKSFWLERGANVLRTFKKRFIWEKYASQVVENASVTYLSHQRTTILYTCNKCRLLTLRRFSIALRLTTTRYNEMNSVLQILFHHSQKVLFFFGFWGGLAYGMPSKAKPVKKIEPVGHAHANHSQAAGTRVSFFLCRWLSFLWGFLVVFVCFKNKFFSMCLSPFQGFLPELFQMLFGLISVVFSSYRRSFEGGLLKFDRGSWVIPCWFGFVSSFLKATDGLSLFLHRSR